MNTAIACPFPETFPDERFVAPLVQVFGQVVHLQAVENTPPEPETEAPFLCRYRQDGRLHTFVPAPLGDQRERFLALVRDMRQRGETYTSQLSMLTLAGLNRRETPESPHAILSSVLQGGAIRAGEEAEPLLWQSRLIVQLGEYLDSGQAALNRSLQEIASRQDALFAELCEDADSPFILPKDQHNVEQETDTLLRHRLRAWTRLCFLDGKTAPGLLVTRHPLAMELLQEVYEKRYGHSPRCVLSLTVPLNVSEQAGVAQPLVDSCPGLGKALTRLAAANRGIVLNEEELLELQAAENEWQNQFAQLLSTQSGNHCVLELLYFPEVSAPRLFADSFSGGVLLGREKEDQGGCIIGLISLG